MAITSEEILKYFRKKYPATSVEINSGCDLDIEEAVGMVNQFIIGLTHSDPLDANVRYYELNMQQLLQKYGLKGRCLSWSFEDYELDEIPHILKDLSDYFRTTLDVERMIRKINIRERKGKRYFIVITVVTYNVLFSNYRTEI